MALTDNLDSYWKLDEPSGDASDSVGSNTLTNTDATYSAGKINNGAVFNGTSAVLDGGDIAAFDGIGALSVSFWVYPTTDNTRGMLVSKDQNGQRSWFIDRAVSGADNKIQFLIGDGTNGQKITTNEVSKNVWTHVVVTYDKTLSAADRIKIYFNGTSQSFSTSTDGSGDLPATTAKFQVGAREYTGSRAFFTGSIDEVGVWSRALSSTEVTSLYNSGNGFQYPFVSGIPHKSYIPRQAVNRASTY